MQRRSQNSLVLLTTLGVYLGLLVVGGAAPQIFAHSATTRFFEIAEEQEARDDFDNNPAEVSGQYEPTMPAGRSASIAVAVRTYLAFFAADFYQPQDLTFGRDNFGFEPASGSALVAIGRRFFPSDVRGLNLILPVHLARASI